MFHAGVQGLQGRVEAEDRVRLVPLQRCHLRPQRLDRLQHGAISSSGLTLRHVQSVVQVLVDSSCGRSEENNPQHHDHNQVHGSPPVHRDWFVYTFSRAIESRRLWQRTPELTGSGWADRSLTTATPTSPSPICSSPGPVTRTDVITHLHSDGDAAEPPQWVRRRQSPRAPC